MVEQKSNKGEQATSEDMNDEVALQEVTTYVRNNIIPAREGRKCVDGRYPLATEDSGMIARAGGDFGYVMVLLSLNRTLDLKLTPEECFDKIFDIVEKHNGTFYMHTDEHADPKPGHEHAGEKPLIGCGHIAKAANGALAGEYEVNDQDMLAVVAHARKRIENGDAIRLVNLGGEHEEPDVIRVTGTQKTINPNDGKTMHFMEDAERDRQFIRGVIVPNLGLAQVTDENFTGTADVQTMATLQNLAAGKRIFDVNVDGPEPIVKFVGRVPLKAAA